jgi:hypothetical protein
MTTEELRGELWETVEYTAKCFDLGIGSDCAHHLREFIHDGVQRLDHEGFLKDRRRVYQAETRLTGFVGGMIYEAKRQHATELREFTFFAAKETFCPSWPFC